MKPLSIGLLGAGNIWNQHKIAFQARPDLLRLAAVYDPVAANAARAAAEFPGAAICATADELVRRDDIDAVLILTTHAQHHSLAIAALRAGRHVLVEKPMACTLAEANEMAAAARAAKRILMIGQCQRYDASYAGIRRLIQSGELGRIHAIRFDSMQGLFPNDLLPANHWLCDGAAAGGGVVISVSVHRIDLCRYLVGEVNRVSALMRTSTPHFKNGAEDFACALLDFSNGAIGEMFATYSGFRMPYSEGLMIFGEHGAIHAQPNAGEASAPAVFASTRTPGKTDENRWLAQFRGFTPVPLASDECPHANSFVNQLVHFADCVRTGATPASGADDNLGTMRTIHALYESARTGGWVNV
jgi:predicted dehydrogenase